MYLLRMISLLGQILHQLLVAVRGPQTTIAYLAIQPHLPSCFVNTRPLNLQGAHLPCFRLLAYHPPPRRQFIAPLHPRHCSPSPPRSLPTFYRLLLSSFCLKLLQNQDIPHYSYRDQTQFFRDALNLPMSPGAGGFVPQQMYRPHTNSDRRRYVEEVQLEQPIYFWMENPAECGIPLMDALHSRVRRLQNRDETVFAGRGPSISVRIQVSDDPAPFPHIVGS